MRRRGNNLFIMNSMQEKPYVICHMVVSLDGKVTGDYLESETGTLAAGEYFRIHREFSADAFLCGRTTMEGSFTHGTPPYLASFSDARLPRTDYIAETDTRFYAVAVDPRGKLGWADTKIHDEDPGYDNAHIIEVLTESVSDAFLAFLRSRNISYIFCGETEIDIPLMLSKLSSLFPIKKLLLEGGGVTNGFFADADAIDELSLVVAPVFDGNANSVNLFERKTSSVADFRLLESVPLPHDALHLRYLKKQRLS